jgi:V-type H+-transporting ATPase subunit a
MISQHSNYMIWNHFLVQERAIYHTLNLFENDANRSSNVAEGWCVRRLLDDVNDALERGMERSGAQIPSLCSEIPARGDPPTHFPTNKLTSAFQAIVDAYGVGNYREANPMPFTVVRIVI